MEKVIAVLDMMAFFAFVECIERKLDPFTTPLVVCDSSREDNTIVLSVTPYLKKLGVPSRCRKKELPYIKGLIYAVPRMALYVEKSAQVMSIILDFVGKDDLHIYSIDEAFLNIGPYLKLNKCSPIEFVKKIQRSVLDKLGLIITAGIAPNPFMAKTALHLEGKKSPPYVCQWTIDDLKEKFWPLSPMKEMWGVNTGYERRLNDLGIYKVEDLALYDRHILQKHLGVVGLQLHDHANGIDESNIREKYIPTESSIGVGQTLFRDYTYEEAKLLLREMIDTVCFRLRMLNQKTQLVSVMIGYSAQVKGGFANSMSLDLATDDNDVIYEAIMKIYNSHVKDLPIRKLAISLGKLMRNDLEQLSLFISEDEQTIKSNYYKSLDEVQKRFGKDSLQRASSLLDHSTIKERNKQIGGHKR